MKGVGLLFFLLSSQAIHVNSFISPQKGTFQHTLKRRTKENFLQSRRLPKPLQVYSPTNPNNEKVDTKPVEQLRNMLSECQREKTMKLMPCAYDALSAHLIELSGFEVTFMTGFGVSAARGHPDTQLISYGEMMDSARQIGEALGGRIPCIADGDTGYGNPVNVKRTVQGYLQMGMAGIMLEDQVSPKRCGHTKGKAVVTREEALARIQAAVDARRECGQDIVIMARTDARTTLGMDEAIERCREFVKIGADITFLEAPESVEEMKQYCVSVEGPKLVNIVQNGKTPILPPKELQDMGYTLCAYPVTCLGAAIKGMRENLELIKQGLPFEESCATFGEIKTVVGFDDYYIEEERYKY